MSKATEMLAKLSEAGLSTEKAGEIVKGEIAAGNIIADGEFIEKSSDAIPKADVAAIEEAAAIIAKAIQVDTSAKPEVAAKESLAKAESPYAEEGDVEDDEEVEDEEEEGSVEASKASKKKASKASSGDKDSDDYDIVAIVSKGADQILDSVESQNRVLASGYMALKDTFANFANVLNKASAKIVTLEDTVTELNKALGQPVAPRSVTGIVEPVPAPGEASINKGMAEVSPSQTLLAKAKSMLAEGTDASRQYQLALAVAELETGASPDDVAVRYSINVH